VTKVVGYIAMRKQRVWLAEVGWTDEEEWIPVSTYGGTAKMYTTEGRARAAVSGVEGATIFPVAVDLP
jgi:hypothetical protein